MADVTECPVGSRRKGLPWWGLIFVVVVIGIVVWKIPALLGWVVGHQLRSHAVQSPPKQEQATAPLTRISKPLASVNASDVSDPLSTGQKKHGDVPEDTNSIVCVGFAIFGNDATAYFSDGSVAYSDCGEIQEIKQHWVTAFGRRYRVIVGRPMPPAPSDVRSPYENQGQPQLQQ